MDMETWAKEQLLRDRLEAAGGGTLPTERPKATLQEVRYTHEAAIDMIVANPGISQGELARTFGYSEPWMSTVVRSDAFQSQLKARKAEVFGPLWATLEEKVSAAAHAALDRLTERLSTPAAQIKDNDLVQMTKVTLEAAGYGARSREGDRGPAVIINMPGKAPSETAWAQRYTPGGISDAVISQGGTPSGG